MRNFLTNLTNEIFNGILASAKASAAIRTIETQMLDGSYTIQTIGNPATKVYIEFYCSTSIRRTLESYAFSGQPIKVQWRDRIWTGLINGGEIKWENWSRNQVKVQEKLLFDVLVLEEAFR